MLYFGRLSPQYSNLELWEVGLGPMEKLDIVQGLIQRQRHTVVVVHFRLRTFDQSTELFLCLDSSVHLWCEDLVALVRMSLLEEALENVVGWLTHHVPLLTLFLHVGCQVRAVKDLVDTMKDNEHAFK